MVKAIDGIPAGAWMAIRYPKAVFDEQLGQWISDAEVTETPSPPSLPAADATTSPPD